MTRRPRHGNVPHGPREPGFFYTGANSAPRCRHNLSTVAERGYARAATTETEGALVSVSVTQMKNFVGGEWVDAVEGGTMEVINPATGDTIAEVPRGTEADVERAVEAARQALPGWLDTTPKDRMELLLKLADVIDDNADELTRLESQNVGKPLSIARDEMPFSADNLRFFAGASFQIAIISG